MSGFSEQEYRRAEYSGKKEGGGLLIHDIYAGRETKRFGDPRMERDDVVIRKVRRDYLGYGVLGRAFPYWRIIEIASDLYGDRFYEVLMHEMRHIDHPEESEYQVRSYVSRRWREERGRPPVFHR